MCLKNIHWSPEVRPITISSLLVRVFSRLLLARFSKEIFFRPFPNSFQADCATPANIIILNGGSSYDTVVSLTRNFCLPCNTRRRRRPGPLQPLTRLSSRGRLRGVFKFPLPQKRTIPRNCCQAEGIAPSTVGGGLVNGVRAEPTSS